MKKFAKFMLALGFASAILTTTAVAQLLPLSAIFDEYGNGVLLGGAAAGLPDPYPLPSSPFGVDPNSGMTTLVYALPGAVVEGDVVLMEGADQHPSDILRFVQISADQSFLFFFSDLPEPGEINPPPADVGLPSELLPGAVFLPELGPEGNNYAIYTPLPGQPGDASSLGALVTYTFISDGVIPEPNTLALLGLAGGLALLRQRQRARA